MIFSKLPLAGAYVVIPQPTADERGTFARTWCAREFASIGLSMSIAQRNLSHNRLRGTVRGLHYQSPFEEAKVVSCSRGSLHDVIVDLRRESPTYCHWTSVEISAAGGRMVYVPKGFAHGFQTLDDDTDVQYLISEFYVGDAARGIRWDDASFGIRWPLPVSMISERDRGYKDFQR